MSDGDGDALRKKKGLDKQRDRTQAKNLMRPSTGYLLDYQGLGQRTLWVRRSASWMYASCSKFRC